MSSSRGGRQITTTKTKNITSTKYDIDTTTNIGLSSGDTLGLALGMEKLAGSHEIKRIELGIGERKGFMSMLSRAYEGMVNSYEDREDRRVNQELLERSAEVSDDLLNAEKSLLFKKSNNKVIIIAIIVAGSLIVYMRYK